jgi:uncharacterized membrane protein HdeD (DUF308 family)
MTKTVSTILGIIFLVVGLLGFAAPNLMGMHLSVAHNVIHLVSGALALYFGTKGSYDSARAFCIIFGIVYGLLGLIGFVAGGTDYMLTLIPDQLVLGKMDHIIHVTIGILFIVAGFSPRMVGTTTPPTGP